MRFREIRAAQPVSYIIGIGLLGVAKSGGGGEHRAAANLGLCEASGLLCIKLAPEFLSVATYLSCNGHWFHGDLVFDFRKIALDVAFVSLVNEVTHHSRHCLP